MNKMLETSIVRAEEQLSQLFGSYKAEWLKDKIFDLFKEPSYFPDLTTSSPCFLIGGRGTGKTTVLRSLSYEGQFALSKNNNENITSWPFYGIYHRINTNRVTAFKGDEISEDKWIKIFAHYFNLLLCDSMFKFLNWYSLHSVLSVELSESYCRRIGKTLHLQNAKNNEQLETHIENLRFDIEAYINNIADGPPPKLSLQTAPIDTLMEAVSTLPQFQNKNFFFLLDEYENFEDYQQQVVNTYIKHSGQLYSFKVGVRELGWRRRTTLQVNEQLISPADYVRINIVENLQGDKFKRFARSVCSERLSKLNLPENIIDDISKLLPVISADEEAKLLGIQSKTTKIKSKLNEELSLDDVEILNTFTPLEIYFLEFWAVGQDIRLIEAFEESQKNILKWKEKFENYKYALLFTIRKHVRGINKYYAGWDVFAQLASNNIRYLLELVEKSIVLHFQDGYDLSIPISAKLQTIAAQNIGKNYLSEMEGLSVHGAHLTKLLLGLGRVFQVMARDSIGHAPEVNQFNLKESEKSNEDFEIELSDHTKSVNQLITAAVMHLALVRSTGNKLGDAAETKDYDYMIHPIFSAFFVFSHRKKRKMQLAGSQLLGLVNNPRENIREILRNNNRIAQEESLPEQLSLFETYYDSRS